jgi:hypothetical protein
MPYDTPELLPMLLLIHVYCTSSTIFSRVCLAVPYSQGLEWGGVKLPQQCIQYRDNHAYGPVHAALVERHTK